MYSTVACPAQHRLFYPKLFQKRVQALRLFFVRFEFRRVFCYQKTVLVRQILGVFYPHFLHFETAECNNSRVIALAREYVSVFYAADICDLVWVLFKKAFQIFAKCIHFQSPSIISIRHRAVREAGNCLSQQARFALSGLHSICRRRL